MVRELDRKILGVSEAFKADAIFTGDSVAVIRHFVIGMVKNKQEENNHRN